ncbi:MAG TPA: nuclear transport factor 2 family protein [Xanthomonadaceae bacterium]|nr:nuclear transport factor 2 family protein [Xanthomonadaceae bacterium]HVI24662.1 nuclear transport factor 2 family protein [Xanthomonadaceae bacterium]
MSEHWDLERGFWLEGAAFYGRHLARDALLVLPPPAGVLDRAATLASLGDATRWTGVEFEARRVLAPAPGIALLVYRARAQRGGEAAAYRADCSSVYVREDDAWRLALHQQTPLPAAAPRDGG